MTCKPKSSLHWRKLASSRHSLPRRLFIEELEDRRLLTTVMLDFNAFPTNPSSDRYLGSSVTEEGFRVQSLNTNSLYSRYSNNPSYGVQGTTVFNNIIGGTTRLAFRWRQLPHRLAATEQPV